MNGNGAPRAREVRRQDILFSKWCHVIDQGIPWQAALSKEYWDLHLGKLRSGDSIEIHSSDHAIRFQMHVIDISQAVDYLLVGFAPLWPLDLLLPKGLPLQRPPRFVVRQLAGSSLFGVVDLQSGAGVDERQYDRSTAQELAATLERAAEHSETA